MDSSLFAPNSQVSMPSYSQMGSISPIGSLVGSSGSSGGFNFGNLMSNIGNFASSLSPLGAVAGGLGSLTSSIFGFFNAKRQIEAQKEMNERNVQAQLDMNAANIKNQNDINASQLAHADKINELMRWDSKHAISDKKADMARAGYSTADPNMQGFSAAALTNPQQVMATQEAPHVESEYNQAASDSIMAGLSSLSSVPKLISDIDLQKAMSLQANSNATGQDIENAWADYKNSMLLATAYKNLDLMASQEDVNSASIEKMRVEMDNIRADTDTLVEGLTTIRFNNSKLAKRFEMEVQTFRSNLAKLRSDIALNGSQIKLNNSNSAYVAAQTSYQSIVNTFASHGITMSGDLFNSIGRLVYSKNGKQVTTDIIDYALSSISTASKRFPDIFNSYQQGMSESLPGLLKTFAKMSPTYQVASHVMPWFTR